MHLPLLFLFATVTDAQSVSRRCPLLSRGRLNPPEGDRALFRPGERGQPGLYLLADRDPWAALAEQDAGQPRPLVELDKGDDVGHQVREGRHGGMVDDDVAVDRAGARHRREGGRRRAALAAFERPGSQAPHPVHRHNAIRPSLVACQNPALSASMSGAGGGGGGGTGSPAVAGLSPLTGPCPLTTVSSLTGQPRK